MDEITEFSPETIATILDQTPNGIIIFNHKLQVAYTNSRAIGLLDHNLLGYSLEKLAAALDPKPKAQQVFVQSCQRSFHTKLSINLEFDEIDIRIIPVDNVLILGLQPHLGAINPLNKLNAKLELQVQQRTAELEKAIAWEAMLKRITDRVRDSLDQHQILQQAVKELALVLHGSSCNAALYDLAQSTSTIAYEYTTDIPGSQGRVARMNDYPELYTQLLNGHYFQFCSITPNPVRGRVAMLACPIFDNEGILGDLWLVKRADYAFSEFEIRFVQQAANQCAIALRQAKLYQAAQAQVQELETLNRLKDDFLSAVSHELRTPMTNMKMAILMLEIAVKKVTLQEPIALDVPLKLDHYLTILKQECEREIQLINDLLDLQRLESGSQSLDQETIDLREWLMPRLHLFQDRIDSHQQQFVIKIPKNLPPITTNLHNFDRIISELVNNACKYTPTGEKIQVIVTRKENYLQITVSNSGVEIPAPEQTKVFDKFYRMASNDPWKQGGTGLGLALVRQMVEQLRGTIVLRSHTKVTKFIVRLPLL